MDDVTRSGAAAGAVGASAVARERRAVANGVWGMALFIAAEATLFGSLIATYFYLRFRSPQWPPLGVEAPSAPLPLALTAALVLSTIPIVLAAREAARGRVRATWLLVAGAMLLQGGYLAWQIVLYVDDLDRFSATATSYGSIYFTLLGAHHAHVALGLLLDGWLLARLLRGLTAYRVIAVQAVALYWACVNLIAIAVVLTQVSPA